MKTYQAEILELSLKGHGVIRLEGRGTFFVPGVIVGETVEVEIADEKRNYEKVDRVKILKDSPLRRTPECPHLGFEAGQCTGCPWMMMDYQEQLKRKVKRIEYALTKRGYQLDLTKLRPIIPSDLTLGYRNRAQLKTNGKIIGYVTEGTNELAPINNCMILEPKLQQQLNLWQKQLPRDDWKPTGKYRWNFIEFDDDALDVPLNTRRPFKQGNTGQNHKMKDWLREKLSNFSRDEKVLELFCGSGNFTEIFVDLNFKRIIATEIQSSGLDQLKSKGWSQVEIVEANLFNPHDWKKIEHLAQDSQLLFLDPPREGLEFKTSLAKNFNQLRTVIYISCEPETFARDIIDLTRLGFKLQELQPLDLFPHTPKVEILSVFTR